MTFQMRAILLSILAFACLGGCAPLTPLGDDAPPSASDPRESDAQPEALASGTLSGTSWRLEKIASMDDSEYLPAQTAEYSLKFLDNGTVQVRADCNMGRGGYEDNAPGLTFTPLAMTRAYCGPDSLYDRFVKDLGYVRSYVLTESEKGAQLHLATMADGAILTFNALADVFRSGPGA